MASILTKVKILCCILHMCHILLDDGFCKDSKLLIFATLDKFLFARVLIHWKCSDRILNCHTCTGHGEM